MVVCTSVQLESRLLSTRLHCTQILRTRSKNSCSNLSNTPRYKLDVELSKLLHYKSDSGQILRQNECPLRVNSPLCLSQHHGYWLVVYSGSTKNELLNHTLYRPCTILLEKFLHLENASFTLEKGLDILPTKEFDWKGNILIAFNYYM